MYDVGVGEKETILTMGMASYSFILLLLGRLLFIQAFFHLDFL